MRKVNCLYLKLRITLLPKSICSNERCIGGSSSALGIVDHLGKKVKKLIFHNEQVWDTTTKRAANHGIRIVAS